MKEEIICPTCKTNYYIQPDYCNNCGYPFSGTGQEKSKFVAQQILKKGSISDAKDKVKRARIILWIIGGINAVVPLFLYANGLLKGIYILEELLIGIVFIGFGFLTYKKPLISIVIPLIVLLLYYIGITIVDPINLYKGLLWKTLVLTVLIYGLVGMIKSKKLQKESKYLRNYDYKE